jgi:hypothetical protein
MSDLNDELTLRDIKGRTVECVLETTTIVQQENYCTGETSVSTVITRVIIFTDGTRITL